jgi:hypothetical protein
MRLDISVGRPITRGGLTLFPIYTQQAPGPRYLTGPEAEAKDLLLFTEAPGGALVPELVVMNRGGIPVLLIEGETLLGNKQNRTLNVSVLCPPGPTTVPVSCVEQGRWGAAEQAKRSSRHAPMALRARKTAAVVDSVRTDGSKGGDQGGVWDEVQDRVAGRGVAAATMALEDVYASAEAELHDLVGGLRPLPGQAGVVVASGGRVRLLELFDRPETLAGYWDGLLAGYALDASSTPSENRVTADDVFSFIGRVAHAPVTEAEPVGAGRELHFASGHVHGSALAWEDGLVHLCGFDAIP